MNQTDVALRFVGRTFAARPVFDAETSDREFTIVMSDYALTVLGQPVIRSACSCEQRADGRSAARRDRPATLSRLAGLQREFRPSN